MERKHLKVTIEQTSRVVSGGPGIVKSCRKELLDLVFRAVQPPVGVNDGTERNDRDIVVLSDRVDGGCTVTERLKWGPHV